MSATQAVNVLARQALQSRDRRPWCRPRPQRKPGCCIQPEIPPQKPDLATYSQQEQVALGVAPTWNSPDITTNNDFPWKLLPAVQLVVRNLSPQASAVNALVTLSTSPFGIGMQQTPLSSQKLNLGPGQQATLSFPLTAALLAGDQSLGVYAAIEHPYDSKLINNNGAQVAQGVLSSAVGRSPSLVFPVLNSTGAPRTITLSVLANSLGASVSPVSHAFSPWEQINATLHLNVPGSVHGSSGSPVRNEITVVANASDGSLVGGVTWIYWIDN